MGEFEPIIIKMVYCIVLVVLLGPLGPRAETFPLRVLVLVLVKGIVIVLILES